MILKIILFIMALAFILFICGALVVGMLFIASLNNWNETLSFTITTIISGSILIASVIQIFKVIFFGFTIIITI